jgi:hypothetical protein
MTCAFGLAHVDTPKGDLDMSASALSGPTTTLITGSTVYPYGTTEQFPNMITSDGSTLTETGHYYMECSNKGICDRKSGDCECFDGYEGSSCQRASCPNDCSGHGTCETIAELAEDEFDNVYALWDKDMTMGCACDAGYTGADCSSRACKYGIDPLYIDDESTARVASSTYIVRPGSANSVSGTYSIKFYDVFGEDYKTAPLEATDETSCLDVVTALEALPNTVIPQGSVFCSDYAGTLGDLLGSYAYDGDAGGYHMYSLTFTGNPGYLKPLEIDTYLDGTRETASSNGTAVWSDGMTGEFVDYFATQCEKVYVTLEQIGDADVTDDGTTGLSATPGFWHNLNVYAKIAPDSLTTTESKLLKKCLGDSDGFTSNNIEVYDWDYGADKFMYDSFDSYMMSGTPHAIKLVKDSPNDDYDGGKFALIWYNPKDDEFYVATKPSDAASQYAIFTTDGKAERVYYDLNEDSAYNHTETAAVAYFEQFTNTLYMSFDASCETGGGAMKGKVEPCLQKGDLIFVADANWGQASATLSRDDTAGNAEDKDFFGGATVNLFNDGFADTADLYTITKIWTAQMTATTSSWKEDRYRITVDKNINWDGSTLASPDGSSTKTTGYVQIVKFTPATTGTFTYVSQCSNRGLCNGDDALCECFKGYTNDNCDTQSSLAV